MPYVQFLFMFAFSCHGNHEITFLCKIISVHKDDDTCWLLAVYCKKCGGENAIFSPFFAFCCHGNHEFAFLGQKSQYTMMMMKNVDNKLFMQEI